MFEIVRDDVGRNDITRRCVTDRATGSTTRSRPHVAAGPTSPRLWPWVSLRGRSLTPSTSSKNAPSIRTDLRERDPPRPAGDKRGLRLMLDASAVLRRSADLNPCNGFQPSPLCSSASSIRRMPLKRIRWPGTGRSPDQPLHDGVGGGRRPASPLTRCAALRRRRPPGEARWWRSARSQPKGLVEIEGLSPPCPAGRLRFLTRCSAAASFLSGVRQRNRRKAVGAALALGQPSGVRRVGQRRRVRVRRRWLGVQPVRLPDASFGLERPGLPPAVRDQPQAGGPRSPDWLRAG